MIFRTPVGHQQSCSWLLSIVEFFAREYGRTMCATRSHNPTIHRQSLWAWYALLQIGVVGNGVAILCSAPSTEHQHDINTFIRLGPCLAAPYDEPPAPDLRSQICGANIDALRRLASNILSTIHACLVATHRPTNTASKGGQECF